MSSNPQAKSSLKWEFILLSPKDERTFAPSIEISKWCHHSILSFETDAQQHSIEQNRTDELVHHNLLRILTNIHQQTLQATNGTNVSDLFFYSDDGQVCFFAAKLCSFFLYFLFYRFAAPLFLFVKKLFVGGDLARSRWWRQKLSDPRWVPPG